MAKGIAINGQLHGKLGGTVYYRSNGQQISRAKAENVSNPNTEPQRIQRMIMATVMQAYSLTKEITDHSFEGVKYKQDSMAFFQRVNANKLRSMISADNAAFDPSFTAPKIQALIPNGYTISRGSLAPVPFSFKPGQAGANYPVFGDNLATATEVDEITLAAFMSALRANAGDMVTLVWFDGDSVLYSLTDGENDRENIKYVTMRYVRLKFKDSYTSEELNAVLWTANAGTGYTFQTSFFVEDECSNTELMNDVEVIDADDKSWMQFPNVDAHAIGVIRSRRDNSVWRRSLCEMTCNPGYHYGLSYESGLLAWQQQTANLGNGDWLLNDKKTSVNP